MKSKEESHQVERSQTREFESEVEFGEEQEITE
jgi:hypothetical protein